jgi:hypothetical protein
MRNANGRVTEEPVSYLSDGAKEELYASGVWAAFRATNQYYVFMVVHLGPAPRTDESTWGC